MLLRFRRTLVAAVLAATAVVGVGGWAAADGQTPVTGPPPGTAAWRADTGLGVRLPDPGGAAPDEVAAFFAGLDPAQQEALAVRHPLVVGNLDGVPFRLRYRANALALAGERRTEQARADDPALSGPRRAAARTRAERYAALAGRQVLAFDPRGRGQVAEVYGDLATARRTAVVVPGSDVDLMSFDRARDPYGTPAGMARELRAAAGEQLAVVAWAGYTTPVGVGLDAAASDLAAAGGPRLHRLLAGLAPQAGPVTVFCHSYGSVVCARAGLGPGLAAGLVLLGSPGTDTDRAADLRVPVWAAERNDTDWIGDVPHVSVFGLGHGADPTAPGFGARLVSSAGSHGHTGYFAPGTASLANFTALALGDTAAVRCADRAPECHDAN
ncbi:alpha/beta hydrolase [Kitasatospora sp. NPDC088346]|uniref:alpha/beta hydrolase n=1 Tax=Kitasatospora sp. NPDC088346 TaxID=3364073 RepID=UPI00382012F2